MLSLNEIRSRALSFAKEYSDEFSESAEAKSFWDDFFRVFGVWRRRIAAFEKSVERADGSTGFIDLLWKGTLLIEHKSRGKNLDRAYTQATDYFHGLKDRDLPKYVLVCDFQNFRLFDLDENTHTEFPLEELPEHIHLFGFISGYTRKRFAKEDPVNIQAAERMGGLHDKLKADGYSGHELELMLVRILFCLFAEDTGIFETNLFREYIETRTAEDGSDLGYHLAMLFDVLNSPVEKRQKSLDEQMASFPYVNGKLFEERLKMAAFNTEMRETLLNCCSLDWSRISPAIFGSLFQSVMDADARRNLGAHYTRELNIFKALNPLFLDELHIELKKLKSSRGKNKQHQLQAFIDKLAKIHILDPACGCGNFLVVAYRELRRLELEALQALYPMAARQTRLEGAKAFSKVNVDQCYGIEIEDFPAQIAQVALWLTDHQMNMELSHAFGEYYVRLPLNKSATIIHGNALELDWESVAEPEKLSYIVGNPPFKGKKEQTATEKLEVKKIFADLPKNGVLDYVACWHKKSVQLMKEHPHIKTAFVSTNSICQGEQIAPLWHNLMTNGAEIFFCHRTFQWSNEARGVAAVHCIILGLSCSPTAPKFIFDYATPSGEATQIDAKHINPYLVDFKNIFILPRSKPLQKKTPLINYGSMPIDKGFLILSEKERAEFIAERSQNKKFIKRYTGGKEFINNIKRYCLWLKDASPKEYRDSRMIMDRIAKTRAFRESSDRAATKVLASQAMLFGEIRQPKHKYLLIPKVSSETRHHMPIGFVSSSVIASGSALIVPNATLCHFGILISTMHMAWMRHICGRMKSDYQYSNTIVYNNFPWPQSLTKKQTADIEKTAQAVLDARKQFPDANLADLYDPNTMPVNLVKAHNQLDKAVDKAYKCKNGISEMERMTILFDMYEQLIADLQKE